MPVRTSTYGYCELNCVLLQERDHHAPHDHPLLHRECGHDTPASLIAAHRHGAPRLHGLPGECGGEQLQEDRRHARGGAGGQLQLVEHIHQAGVGALHGQSAQRSEPVGRSRAGTQW